jgi:hypothetical protein
MMYIYDNQCFNCNIFHVLILEKITIGTLENKFYKIEDINKTSIITNT